MVKDPASKPSGFLSGTLGALLPGSRHRSRKSQKTGGSEDPSTTQDDPDSAKAAHLRRREQVRRAQRNHRERKEIYTKTLEKQLLDLRDEVTLRKEFEGANLTNKVLKDIMRAHNIPLPDPNQPSIMAGVVMNDISGPHPYISVHVPQRQPFYSEMREDSSTPPHLVAGDHPDSFLSSQFVRVSLSPSSSGQGQPRKVSTRSYANSEQTMKDQRLTVSSPLTDDEALSHPHNLDNTQVGIDFVLGLEQPCLDHTYHPMCSGEPTGHALTMQAALLSQAPNLESDHSWEIPAVELDRLLNLSFNLDLDGEVTPVQAWNRIRSHPGFRKLTPSALQSLSQAIAEKVACFGFGAVVEEDILNQILHQHLEPWP